MYNKLLPRLAFSISMEFEQKQIVDRVKERFDLPHKTYGPDSVNIFERAGNERIKVFISSATGDASVAYFKKGETSTIGKVSFHADLNIFKAFKSIYRFKPTRVDMVSQINPQLLIVQSESGKWSVRYEEKVLIEDLTIYNFVKLKEFLYGLS